MALTLAREIFIRRRNRNFPGKRICFCCELLCSWISYFQIILGCSNRFNFISQTWRWPAIFGSRQVCYCVNSELVTMGHLPKFMSKLTVFFVKHAGELGVKLQVKKTLFWSRAGWFGDSSKNNISEFKRKNNLRNEKETCSSYCGI